jgi:hypothetical protein
MMSPPPCSTVGTTQPSRYSSPSQRRTYTLPSFWYKQNLDSLLHNTLDHTSLVHETCSSAYCMRHFLWSTVTSGLWQVTQPLSPASHNLLFTVAGDRLMPRLVWSAAFSAGAVFFLLERDNLTRALSSLDVVFLFLPGIFLSLTLPHSLSFLMI